MRAIARAWGCALVVLASPALAAGPEQVEQLEPESGGWQTEVSLLARPGSAFEPSFQLMRGVSDRIALGIEVEGESGKIDSLAPTILYRFSNAADGLGVGVIGQVEFATDLMPVGAEARLVIERTARRWWGQGNVIVKTAREHGQSATALGYSWRISRLVNKMLWIGGEGSGRAAQLGGVAVDDDMRGHFVGPALTIARSLRAGADVEVTASYLRRIADEGPRQAFQLSVQINL